MNSSFHKSARQALSLVGSKKLVEATELLLKTLSTHKAEAEPSVGSRDEMRFSHSPLPLPETAIEPVERLGKAFGKRSAVGTFTSRGFQHAERHLDYMLYIPPPKPAREQSLILMLHGCTQNPTDFALGTRMNILADEFNIIVAYPLQPQSANSLGCWNWFDLRHQQPGSGEPAMLSALAEKLTEEFNIPKRRVFAAGLSAGGAMAEILASTYPQQFAAVGVHSGLPRGAATSLASAFQAMNGSSKLEPASASGGTVITRRIMFHGSADVTVHPSNSERIVNIACQSAGKLKHSEFHKKMNGRDVACTVFQNEKGYPVIEHWLVKGGGHTWFGGDKSGSYTDLKGPGASREMVRFFLHK